MHRQYIASLSGVYRYEATAIPTSDMQGMLWGEPELSHVWVFDHMVFFHSHNVNEV